MLRSLWMNDHEEWTIVPVFWLGVAWFAFVTCYFLTVPRVFTDSKYFTIYNIGKALQFCVQLLKIQPMALQKFQHNIFKLIKSLLRYEWELAHVKTKRFITGKAVACIFSEVKVTITHHISASGHYWS